MSIKEDDLQTRRGKFLPVEKVGNIYRETRPNNEIIEYTTSDHSLEIGVETTALHATSDVSSGTVRHLMTGKTRERFRAIGTEGSYQILDVSVSSEMPPGTILIRETYGHDGHAERSKMLIGLQDETVRQFGKKLPAVLTLGGIEKHTFYSPEAGGQAVMLDYWRDHVVSEDSSSGIVAEWQLTFSTATLSPEGYSGWWGQIFYDPPSKNARDVSGNIGVHYTGRHPLTETVENLSEKLDHSSKNIFYVLVVIAVVLIYFALRGL